LSRILYYFIVKPLSHLPFWALYPLSNFIFFFTYHVFGYRKKTVKNNLRNSFPDKSEEEIKTIQKSFFKHFCDLTLENIKLFNISKTDALDRFKLRNVEILDKYYQEGKSVILVSGHFNNWEMAAVAFDQYTPHQSICIYSPLKDKFFDEKMSQSRSKYGMQMLSKGLVSRSFISNKDKRTITIFAADQSPTYSKQVHWMNFLNQETAVFLGAEIFALKYNYPVIFLKIVKTRRGYYEGTLEVLADNPINSKQGEITELHTRTLEKLIRENPAYWLWSHKRWKRKKTEEELESEITEKSKVPKIGLKSISENA